MCNEKIFQHFEFTQGQERVIECFRKFMGIDKVRIYIIRGYAGTGKTTMVKELVKMLQEAGKNYKLLASTGRAAQILASKTSNEASTVHSCIYIYKDFNQDLDKIIDERERTGMDSSGQLYLDFGLSSVQNPDEQTFYIVDEASMISDEEDKNPHQARFGSGRLLNDLLNYDPMGKFVFVGDECQLPPITQNISPALSVSYFKEAFGLQAVQRKLTEIKRQKSGNDIVLASQKLRKLYENPQSGDWAIFPLKGWRNIKLMPSQVVLVHEYIERVKKHGYADSTLICFSNRQCNELTKIIRPALGLTSPTLQKNDLLLVTQNNMVSGLMNGDLVVIDSVQVKEQRAGLTFLEVSFHDVVGNRNFSQLMIADILYGNATNLSNPQQKELFVDFVMRMKDKKIKQRSQRFNEEMRRDPYLNALRAVYGFALTCHKTQGGEWNNVFLDIPRYFPKTQKPYVYQWMYTAVTRARENFYMVEDFYTK